MGTCANPNYMLIFLGSFFLYFLLFQLILTLCTLISFPLFSWSKWMIQQYYSKEKLDIGHSKGFKG